MALEYYDSGAASASDNMAIDSDLLAAISSASNPILHAYNWIAPAATYGYFCDPSLWLDAHVVQELGLDLARRATGGGITLHTNDLAFSFLLPAHHPAFTTSTLANYAFVNNAVGKAIELWLHTPLSLLPDDTTPLSEGCRHFCMARATRYDIVVNGRKIGGAAQRRTDRGYLHHGTIALTWPDPSITKPLFRDEKVWDAIMLTTLPLLGSSTSEELLKARQDLMHALYTSLDEALASH